MTLRLESGIDSRTAATWSPWPRYAIARIVLTAALLADAAAFVIPQAALVPELWRETAELEERQRAARLVTEAAPSPAAPETSRVDPRSQLNPRDLLPAVSALAREAGMQIVAVKQSVVDKEGMARRIHLRARGGFDRIVGFIDDVCAAIPFGRVEDMTLRHLESSSQQDAGLELEYVLSVPSVDARQAASPESPESETR